jgi:hypothetical protein
MKSSQLIELLICSTVAAYCLARIGALVPEIYEAVGQIAVSMWRRKVQIDEVSE